MAFVSHIIKIIIIHRYSIRKKKNKKTNKQQQNYIHLTLETSNTNYCPLLSSEAAILKVIIWSVCWSFISYWLKTFLQDNVSYICYKILVGCLGKHMQGPPFLTQCIPDLVSVDPKKSNNSNNHIWHLKDGAIKLSPDINFPREVWAMQIMTDILAPALHNTFHRVSIWACQVLTLLYSLHWLNLSLEVPNSTKTKHYKQQTGCPLTARVISPSFLWNMNEDCLVY